MSMIRHDLQVTLAPVCPEELEALRRIAVEAFREDFRRYGAMPEGIETSAWHERGAAEGSYLAIFTGERLAGGARVFDQGGGNFRLGSLFIDPALHGQGIGAGALEAIENRYPQARRWSLDTPAGSERNQRFYRNAGYVKVGETRPDPESEFVLFDYVKLPLLTVIRDADLSLPAAEGEEPFRAASPGDERGYDLRQAARAVLLDAEGRMALMRVARDEYHKLPGGGLEANEDVYAALRRELKEEAGAFVDVTGEIGMTIEYVADHRRKQFSYAYTARLLGSPSSPELTQSEQNEGFAPLWVTPEEALHRMENDHPQSYVGSFIQARDLAILRTYLGRRSAE